MNRISLVVLAVAGFFLSSAIAGRNRAAKASTGSMCSIAVRGTPPTNPDGRLA